VKTEALKNFGHSVNYFYAELKKLVTRTTLYPVHILHATLTGLTIMTIFFLNEKFHIKNFRFCQKVDQKDIPVYFHSRRITF